MQRAKNHSRAGRKPSSDAGANTPEVNSFDWKNHRNRAQCRTTEYLPPGSKKLGLEKGNQPSKVVWELPYSLPGDKYEKLSARFPGYAFVQTGTECHDHPIAHTSYRVVWHNVTKSLPPGALVADIAGNPAFNERYNQGQVRRDNPIQIDTFCKVQSVKDSIRRATRWGPMVANGVTRWEEMTLNDMYRFPSNVERFSHYSHFLMNHCIYYYSMSEINQLLHINPDAVLIATLHKMEGDKGDINCGEQRYVKDPISGMVTQVNVETGEPYRHPDPAQWFRNFCYADEHGAFAWTINKGCDDTYIITATYTDIKFVPEECWAGGRIVYPSSDGMVEVTPASVVEPPPAYPVKVVELKTSDLLPGYYKPEDEKVMKFPITHPELFETLEMFMVNKPRNMSTLRDLTAKAHREVGNNTLRGAKIKLDISSDDLRRHIAAAWGKGAPLEEEMIRFVETTSGGQMKALNARLAGKSNHISASNVVKQVARFALLADGVRTAKTPHVEALQLLEDLF